MAIDLGEVTKTGHKWKQITTIDIHGQPSQDASSYNITLVVKTFESFDDGVRVIDTQKVKTSVSSFLLDENQEPIPQRVQLMNDFITTMYSKVV